MKLLLFLYDNKYEGKSISKLQMDIELKQIRISQRLRASPDCQPDK
jgi:hypothetical protein